MNSAVDPWVITPRERTKYQEQFKSLKPQNDIVTGMQARGFFLQSQLPPQVLGEIWSLADTDADGKMDINEFSIACKLINLKLRSFEIPKVLPPVLIASLSAVGGTPTLTPTGMSPLSASTPTNNVQQPPARPPMPTQNVLPHAMVTPLMSKPQPPVIIPMMHPATSMTQQPSIIDMMGGVAQSMPMSQPLIPGVQSMGGMQQQMAGFQPIPSVQPMISMQQQMQPIASVQPLISAGIPPSSYGMPNSQQPLIQPVTSVPAIPMGIDLLGNKIPSPVDVKPNLPAPPTPPQSNTPSRSMSISEKAPSIDSPGSASGQIEWAIKSQAKLKYTQLFNTTDRTRSGFLTGPQARNIMVQTKLPQANLAQIWALADMDSDGRLGCDEFVLAMYLCDMALQGDAIPTKLPIELIPPSFRKLPSRHGSIAGSSRHGSVSSQGGQCIDADPSAGLPGQTSFEDKRKENFDKGQAELERRRKVLLDIQRKEQEERERKEREEFEKREKARLEAERRQQEELERQLQIQREIEQEKEEKRKREIEQKEAARKEMEKQRQLEWEKQRISEMQLQRQREQEKVLKLKSQNQTYTIEQSTLDEKIKELSQKICDTRASVTNVKTVIDGMRSTRDTFMSEQAQLKARIKEQNQKLVHLSQEKAKLDSKNRSSTGGSSVTAEQEIFSNKQIIINQLKGKLESLKEDLSTKQSDISTNTEQLTELKTQLGDLITDCESIYSKYDIERTQVIEMKNNRKNESMTSAWDTTNSWPTNEPEITAIKQSVSATATAASVPGVGNTNAAATYTGYEKYRAIYEFYARNADEITFQPGDIVMVPIEQNAEPGWLAGEINGHTGWFPETYVEKCLSPSEDINYNQNYVENKRQLEEISEVVETPVAAAAIEPPIADPVYNGECEEYIACYPYESTEIGDLIFTVGERISVIKKEGDWWTGIIGTRTGIFPSNYVQPATNTAVSAVSSDYNNTSDNTQNGPSTVINSGNSELAMAASVISQAMDDEAKTQEEADTEVSEINTQPKSENVQETYSRPMSTSTTPGLRKLKGEVAQVIAPYEATSTEQLSLQRGQLIMLRKKTDSGWWEGELQARGRRRQIGWFPASFVKVLQSGRLSGRSTPVSGGKIQMNETILDKVIALFPYKAQNDDELSFEKDDIISVLGKDEPEWWRGECQGLTGLFPSNYVGPFVTSGNV